MKKTLVSILAALLVILAVDAVFAEAAEPYAAERAGAVAAVQAAMPGAAIDYAVRERDDGRYEWSVFFRQDGVLGEAKVLETGSELRKVELFNQSRESSLTASEAMAKLAQEKGEMTIVDLELDWDDGRLAYEGEAEMNGKRYEFEMTAEGRIIEWERD